MDLSSPLVIVITEKLWEVQMCSVTMLQSAEVSFSPVWTRAVLLIVTV